MINNPYQDHCSDYRRPDDFADFWSRTITEARNFDQAPQISPVDTGLATIDVFDIVFPGFAGHPIHGWLRIPRDAGGSRLPGVVQFHGYGSGRGHPLDDLLWSSAGYLHLIMDTRGQGAGGWAAGATGDPEGTHDVSHPGFMTRGIEDPERYYYRRVFTDGVRAVDALRSLDLVDPNRVAVIGNSQGGGIALAVAGLVGDLAALWSQSPLLSDIEYCLTHSPQSPYDEITGYLASQHQRTERTLQTLHYFDGIGFAQQARATAWFSCGLDDRTCPPASTYASYQAYAGPATITAWPFNGHDAGGSDDLELIIAGFADLLYPAGAPEPTAQHLTNTNGQEIPSKR